MAKKKRTASKKKGGSRRKRTYTTSELASELDVGVRTIGGWIQQGCPVKVRGDRGVQHKFDINAVRDWIRNRESRRSNGRPSALAGPLDFAALLEQLGEGGAQTEPQVKLQKLIAEAGLKQLQYERELGRLVSVDEAVASLVGKVAVLRTRLLKAAETIPPSAGIDDAACARLAKIMRANFEQLCRDFGKGVDGIDVEKSDLGAVLELLGLERS